MLDIAGGLYHELCDFPAWRTIRGSGGRAAAALSGITKVRLHCYATPREQPGVDELTGLGVSVSPRPAETGIAFAYFHSLSTPHIEPPLARIPRYPALRLSGRTVLRFGLLEGDAVVEAAGRAVYDPQTWRDPAPFSANGSVAAEWALVANAIEVAAIGRSGDPRAAADTMFREQGPEAIVMKRGPAGAVVFSRDGTVAEIPAYRSSTVFKIGTGDVFSAAFALFWAERGMPPADAADRASRAVAAYCEAPHSGISEESGSSRPAISDPASPIAVVGADRTIGQRYLLEEVRFRLTELGATAIVPQLGAGASLADARAALVLADGATAIEWKQADDLAAMGLRRVILAQDDAPLPQRADDRVTSDFATALYHASWLAAEPEAPTGDAASSKFSGPP